MRPTDLSAPILQHLFIPLTTDNGVDHTTAQDGRPL